MQKQLSTTLRVTTGFGLRKTRSAPQHLLRPQIRPAHPYILFKPGQEMLKTRVAHGFCALPAEAGACPYANICEQCDNFMPALEFAPILQAQLDDVRALRLRVPVRPGTCGSRSPPTSSR